MFNRGQAPGRWYVLSRLSTEIPLKRALLVVLLCVTALVAMCAWHFRTITVAYRLTIAVQVDGVTHTGSGVVAANIARNANPLWPGYFAISNRGEAVVVDLGRYGPLFLILQGKYDVLTLAQAVYGSAKPGQDVWDYFKALGEPKPARNIPHDALPLLVRFRDTSKPSTVECVNPDDMASSFPPGTSVRLVKATIAIVNASVTTGQIEKWLPWLNLPWREMDRRLTGPRWQWRWGFVKKDCLLRPSYLESTK